MRAFSSAIPLIKQRETNIDAGNCSHDHRCSPVTVRAFHKPATVIRAGWAEANWETASPSLDIWKSNALVGTEVGVAIGIDVGVAVGAWDGLIVGAKDGEAVGAKDGPLVGAPEGSSAAIDAATGSYKASKDSVAANPGRIQYVETKE